ncbi:transcriptional repressor, partial [Candidatus Bathyarchaeota archaeon]|nr:transcriptional repressor [Candidatus Bathyarchaeota archaeon]
TIYKTLKILKELDFIQELPFYSGKTRFDPNMRPHVNLVCLKCGKVRDLNDPSVETFIRAVAKKRNFKVAGQRIDIYGLCDSCS